MRTSSIVFVLASSLSFVAACTEHVVTQAPASEQTPSEEQGPETGEPAPEAPAEPAGPWTEIAALPAAATSLSCPADGDVHAATAKGLYRLEGAAWKKIADGAFDGVSLASPTNGFAGGAGLLVQLTGAGWSKIDISSSWRVRALFTTSEGVWMAGDGFQILGAQLPIEPKVLFVDGKDLTMPPERAYGSRLTAGTIDFVTGNDLTTVVIGGSIGVQRWNGSQWQRHDLQTYLPGVRSAAVVGSGVFATDGKEIVEPGGSAWDPRGAGRMTPEVRELVAYERQLVGVGDDGFVLRRSSSTGDYEQLEEPASVDLQHACVTADGRLWVSGGTKVFRRTKTL